jgi:RING-variant domain
MSNIPPQTRAWAASSESDEWHSVPSNIDTSASIAGSDIPADPNAQTSLVVLNPVISGDQQQSDTPSSGVLVVSDKKKCWICLAEEDELASDGVPLNNSRWSKACACSLDAHETCLITWINQTRGGDASKTVRSIITTNIDDLSTMQRTV